ncbi:TPA: Clp protease ClpP [Staphylococcus aureus]|uniref:head maturation protease, ClpP-related n=1 Tax=Staphylococcus aureus TaxID=1280 RepID=UPI000E086DFE|nr:head maturation protease, ClpP-related [Staphylococcus aureus]SUK03226.1 phage protease [Staphylococcus aureus]SUK11023.1 phage protease [Staphylococcus aureus]HDD0210833.1 Clp protease ClpP [Staphylococcus aureus]HDD0305260.1 Clp protease ClpP [Staphylococcus aureus]HDD0308528.1 Clp protease ClpP [Staphylococcus aureus]
MSKKAKYFQMKRKSDSKGEIYIYGDIVTDKWFENDVTATDFKNKLDELGNVNEIDVHINSAGGNVFEGHAIYNMLRMHPAKINIYVDALAASIASVIAMSGDAIFMHKNSFLMIHNSWIMTVGNAKELRKMADLLEKTDTASNSAYLDKAKDLDQGQLKQMLDAETWLTAEEALSFGLIDEVLGANEIAASISKEQYKRFNNVPEDLKKDVDKITKIDDLKVENKNRRNMEQRSERERIKNKAEMLLTYIN